MRNPLAIVLGGITLLAIVLTFALSVTTVNRDLVSELVLASLILEVPSSAISQPTTSGDVGIDVSLDLVQEEFLLYKVDLAGQTITFVDEVDAGDETLLMYREISTQRSLSQIAEGAETIVLIMELRAFRPNNAPPLRSQAIALDADGNAIASDWRGRILEDQIQLLSDAIATQGITWSDAITALIDSGRDRELKRESDNALGQAILDIVSPLGG
jgi:hypothetical protein